MNEHYFYEVFTVSQTVESFVFYFSFSVKYSSKFFRIKIFQGLFYWTFVRFTVLDDVVLDEDVYMCTIRRSFKFDISKLIQSH